MDRLNAIIDASNRALEALRTDQLLAVADLVHEQTGVTLQEMISPSRQALISRARQDATLMLLALRWTLREIGQAFGGRDHTSILYLATRGRERRRERLSPHCGYAGAIPTPQLVDGQSSRGALTGGGQ